MSMIPCPGCGLPRVEDQVETACPVCAAPAEAPLPTQTTATVAPDPTAGLPADVGELRDQAAPPGFPRWLPWVAVFLLGTAVGAAGSRGWQSAPTEVAVRNPPADEPIALPQPTPSVPV